LLKWSTAVALPWGGNLSAAAPKPDGNLLISSLPAKGGQQLLRLCEPVKLHFGTILCEINEPLEYAYFPVTALISLVIPTKDHQPLALAMIGNEGILGATLALGIPTPRLRGVVHGDGDGLRISAPRLRMLLLESPALQSVLMRYAFVLMGQLLQTASCNSFHEVEMRLARWLLMTDDRAKSDQLPLTHQFLADALGVQRSAVTIAAGKLQRKKLIKYNRGNIRILSRQGLEKASCECYGLQVKDHADQFAT